MASIREQANRLSQDSKGLSELWSRILFVIFGFLIYRFGTHIPLPGVNPEQIAALFEQGSGTILGMANMFSGGALERMSIMALGIIPYITAAIIVQLLAQSGAMPYFAELRKEGASGQRKLTQYTRWLTLAIALVQAIGLTSALLSQEQMTLTSGLSFYVPAITGLVAGAMFIMWLGEQMNERGIGNGISLLIFASIVAGMPAAIGQAFELTRNGTMQPLMLLVIFLIAIAVVLFIVYVERAQRRVKINYAQRHHAKEQFGSQNYLPLKVNMAGVMPPIFATALLMVPATLAQFAGTGSSSSWLQTLSVMLSPGQVLYTLIFAGLIFVFCYFYTAMTFDSRDVANNLKRSNAFLPGIRPGEKTSEYIDGVVSRLTLWGALYIVLVCVIPLLVYGWANDAQIAFYLGGTSLLIAVVVIMDLMGQVQAHVMSSQYEKMMKNQKLKGKKR